jgi:hypothetical protein
MAIATPKPVEELTLARGGHAGANPADVDVSREQVAPALPDGEWEAEAAADTRTTWSAATQRRS